MTKEKTNDIEKIEILKAVEYKNFYIIFDLSILEEKVIAKSGFSKESFLTYTTALLKIFGSFKNVYGACITGYDDPFIFSETPQGMAAGSKDNSLRIGRDSNLPARAEHILGHYFIKIHKVLSENINKN
jgi:hypothetical protein